MKWHYRLAAHLCFYLINHTINSTPGVLESNTLLFTTKCILNANLKRTAERTMMVATSELGRLSTDDIQDQKSSECEEID